MDVVLARIHMRVYRLGLIWPSLSCKPYLAFGSTYRTSRIPRSHCHGREHNRNWSWRARLVCHPHRTPTANLRNASGLGILPVDRRISVRYLCYFPKTLLFNGFTRYVIPRFWVWGRHRKVRATTLPRRWLAWIWGGQPVPTSPSYFPVELERRTIKPCAPKKRMSHRD